MRRLTVVCNVVLLAFTALVVMTDGAPTETPYIAFTLLLLLVPTFTVVAIVRRGAGTAWTRVPAAAGAPTVVAGGRLPEGVLLERAAAIANVVLLVCVVAAVVAQYPHPKEEGVVAFVLLCLATPIVSTAALLRRARRA